MRHFFKVGEVNVQPLLHAIQRQPDLWNKNSLRTKFPGTPHSEADDIWLWFNSENSDDPANDRETVPYPAWDFLPQARQIVFDLMRAVEACQLGRVIITKLTPGKQITPHVDGGAPAQFYKRYQVALQSLPGAIFVIEDEKVNFKSGEVWLINNRAEHSVQNNSADDRIVMIVDVRPG
jgi:hypothetical protein